MSEPIDGFGIYVDVHADGGTSQWTGKLPIIRDGGFNIIIVTGGLFGTAAQLNTLISYASGIGLKTVVMLNDPAIWKTSTYNTAYPAMYADSGNAATGVLFAEYIINQTKTTSGLYGYYLAQEVQPSDAATWQGYASALATSMSNLPSIGVGGSTGNPIIDGVFNGTSPIIGYCSYLLDDYYDIGYYASGSATVATVAAGIQSQATSHSAKSGIEFQCFSFATSPVSGGIQGFPAQPPTLKQMIQHRNDAVSYMSPQLMLLWQYEYSRPPYCALSFWSDLCYAYNGIRPS